MSQDVAKLSQKEVNKGSNFKLGPWNHGYKTMILRFIQPIMKESLLLLRDLLEPWRIKSTNIWLQYAKTYVLMN